MDRWTVSGAVLAAIGVMAACGGGRQRSAVEDVPPVLGTTGVEGGAPTAGSTTPSVGTRWVTAVDPKALSATVKRGLNWVLATQHEDGGWGQGEESPQMRSSGEPGQDPSNVADTCISMLALLRASPTPERGPYAEALLRGAGFVCSQVEASDAESLYVTDVRGTRVQMKIGTYVDTFFASLVLAELKWRTGDHQLNARVAAALDKVLGKIERHQQADGGFEGQGWAPVLSQSIAGKGLNRAAQVGARISADALASNQGYFAKLGYADQPAAAGAAGVALYSSSAGLAGLQEHANTGAAREKELLALVETSSDAQVVAEARAELGRLEEGRRAQGEAQEALVARLDDESFVSGFGSNGGEEFLSYMNISESLVLRADDAWRRWDQSMTQNLGRIQNQDGSWSGHHCITGRNFCTAAALLVLLADRTPVPAEMVAKR